MERVGGGRDTKNKSVKEKSAGDVVPKKEEIYNAEKDIRW